MRRLSFVAVVLIAAMSYSPSASAQVFACSDCRGAYKHYKDFGNFVFNAFWGADPWLGAGVPDSPNYTNPVKVSNLRGQVVEVVVPIPLNMLSMPDNVVEIMVIKPNGVVERYEVSSSRLGQNLPVGRRNGSGATGPGGGGGPSGGSGPASDSGPSSGPSGPTGTGGRCGTSEVDGDSDTRRRTCN